MMRTEAWIALAVGALLLGAGQSSAQDSAASQDQARVYFRFGSARLSPVARTSIGAIASRAQAVGSIQVRVVGHTDTSGSPEYNQWLSMRRTKAVVDELIRNGIASEIVVADWRGEFEPATDEGDEAYTEANRRVVITLGSQN